MNSIRLNKSCDGGAGEQWLLPLILLPSLFLLVFSWIQITSRGIKGRTAHGCTLLISTRIILVQLLIVKLLLELREGMESVCLRSTAILIIGSVKFLSLVWLIVLIVDAKSRGLVRSGVAWIFVLMEIVVTAAFLILNSNSMGDWIWDQSLWLLLLMSCSISDYRPKTPSDKAGASLSRNDVSFPSLLTLNWVMKLALRGLHQPLQVPDLLQLEPDEEAACVATRLRRALWTKDGMVKRSLGSALMSAFAKEHVIGITLALVSDSGNLVNAFILRALLQYTSGSENMSTGYLIALVMAICSLSVNLSQNWHLNYAQKTGVRMRTAVMDLVFNKSLTLCNSVRKDLSVGEMVNLLSVDADRLRTFMDYGYVLVSAPLLIMAATFILFRELGLSALIGMLILLLGGSANFIVSRWMKEVERARMRAKDERVNKTSEVLSNMKIVKLYAWEQAFIDIITKCRETELSLIHKIDRAIMVPALMSHGVMLLVVALVFVLYLLLDPGAGLTPVKLFFCLAVLTVIRAPIGITTQVLGSILTTRAAVQRIARFLSLPDRTDYVTRDYDDRHAVTMCQAELSWFGGSEEGTFVLRVDEVSVARGSLTAVVGSVGSGKSSLLSAILGDMELKHGSINIAADVNKIAYVPQQAWILNRSVKQNILFDHEYDEDRYRRVIACCDLQQDLDMLPAGDETEIGEKGINLSGGQKQRISIARACYSDADLFLFDDPLSAVDAHVAKHLIDNVFSSATGLLNDKTRILVTNNVSVLPAADQIVTLTAGRTSTVTNLEQLLQDADLVAGVTDDAADSNKGRVDNLPAARQRTCRVGTEDKSVAVAAAVLIQEETRSSGSVNLSVYLTYFKYMPLILVAIPAQFLTQAFDAGIPIFLSLGSRNSIEEQQEDRWTTSAVALLFVVLSASSYWLAMHLTTDGVISAARSLHTLLLKSVMHATISLFETTPMARILNRFVTDMEGMESMMQRALLTLQSNMAQTTACIAIVVYVVPWFAIAILPLTLLIFVTYKYGLGAERQVRRLVSTTQSLTYSYFTETVTGMSSVRAYGAADTFRQGFEARVNENQRCSHSQTELMSWRCMRLDLIGNLTVIMTTLYAVQSHGSMNPALLGLAVVYAVKLPTTLNKLIRGVADLESYGVSVERVVQYLDIEPEANWETGPETKLPISWPEKGLLKFDHLSARYRPGLDLVLSDLCFEIKSKEKVGIVGRTGAGKSTIPLSLFRLMEPADGSIVIDDIDVRSIGLHDLRSKLTIIPQDPILFSGTIRSNLDPFDQKTDQLLWRCLESAHLSNCVRSQPAGLQYGVTEAGENLSVGQRQLLCLARALARNTVILIMDEATAAVDTDTDALIQQTIRKEFADCTVLTIAHRLNTILDSDRVLVMEAGRVAEFDSPQSLLSNPDSKFFSLARDAGVVD